MSPPGQSSAHWALNVMGGTKTPNAPVAPPVAAPASDVWYTKQQTCPAEQCCVLEHASDNPVHDPADVQVGAAATGPPPKAPIPPAPGPASDAVDAVDAA